ncbi:protein of unknown function [Pseudomonas inefficax]|uniref:PIN like domain-containing protein n=1 Tax=Pseudomonas inefficax TaxID=2078786 RepID=A0AAQ1P931_9PSED|nr:protein of unknown function [Pseudomonas inefficax]
MEDRLLPYGDYIGWLQLLEKSRTDGLDVIYVTGDNKEDWWLRLNGKTLGPLPALVEEFISVTSQRFYMYLPDRFLERAGEFLDQKVSAQAMEEVREARRDDPLSDTSSSIDLAKVKNNWAHASRILADAILKRKDLQESLALNNLYSTIGNVSSLRLEAAALQWELRKLMAEQDLRLVDGPSESLSSVSDADLDSKISEARSKLNQTLLTLSLMEGSKGEAGGE